MWQTHFESSITPHRVPRPLLALATARATAPPIPGTSFNIRNLRLAEVTLPSDIAAARSVASALLIPLELLVLLVVVLWHVVVVLLSATVPVAQLGHFLVEMAQSEDVIMDGSGYGEISMIARANDQRTMLYIPRCRLRKILVGTSGEHRSPVGC